MHISILYQEIYKIFISKKRILTQNYTWYNRSLMCVIANDDRMVNPYEGCYSNNIKEVMDKLPYKIIRFVNKANHLLNFNKNKNRIL